MPLLYIYRQKSQ